MTQSGYRYKRTHVAGCSCDWCSEGRSKCGALDLDTRMVCGRPASQYEDYRGPVCALHSRGRSDDVVIYPKPKEAGSVEAKSQEGPAQENQEGAASEEGTAVRADVLNWQVHYQGGRLGYFELVAYFEQHRIALVLAPLVSDTRGYWVGKVFGLPAVKDDVTRDLDVHRESEQYQGFPRYYMDLGRAKAELRDWLAWQLMRIV